MRNNSLLPFAGYCYSEIGRILGNNTRKSIDFQVFLAKNSYKNTLDREYLRENENVFKNILWGFLLYH